MWVFDNEYSKWISNDDKLLKDNFDFYKQELSSVRFYSKSLSGATFMPINNLDDIYDILGSYKPRNWYVGINGSEYTNTLIPSKNATEINGTSSDDYYNKYITEEGLTLKTMFTPKRLIKDSVNNYIYVDAATTGELNNIGSILDNFYIDGVKLIEGHKVLVKDQKTIISLPNTTDPDTYFQGNYKIFLNLGAVIEYEYFNQENGIYIVKNKVLEKTTELDNYVDTKRFGVSVKMGTNNTGKQFHLSRLLNGYYPNNLRSEPMEFIEKKNWMLRNKVDYNNLFEINYYDIIKHNDQSYYLNGVTYSIPERIISVGEFGIILNNQNGVSNIIRNKYKVNLRGISQNSKYYWICGDSGTLLRVRKHDFDIKKIKIELDNKYSINLKSVSFFNDLRGAAVGDLNTVYITTDGGDNWKRLRVPDFDSFYFNKVVFTKANSFFIGGNTGVFIEMYEDLSGWTALRRRISRFVDDDDEYLLVDNINDLQYSVVNTWGLSFSYGTQSINTYKELLFIVTDDSKIIVHDINDANGQFDFLYLDFQRDYDDILNISRREGSNKFFFTGIDIPTGNSGLFSFDLSDFQYIGVGNSYSNTIITSLTASYESSIYPNEIYDYSGQEILVCGNTSVLYSSNYEQGGFIQLDTNVSLSYGYLYNWYSLNQGSSGDGRSPGGIVNTSQVNWIVPADSDWLTLFSYLGTSAGGKMKSINCWAAPNTGALNSSGFSTLPAGVRLETGAFSSLYNVSYFQSSDSYSATQSLSRDIIYSSDGISPPSIVSKNYGMSVRLVRPTTTFEDTLPDGTWLYDNYEGNNGLKYPTVKIGNQMWLSENLIETKDNVGNLIANITSPATWQSDTTGAICSYNNLAINTCTVDINAYQGFYDSLDLINPDPDFEKRLKSKLLFLDYDAGSKLNFFDDFGGYRLPNSLTFSSASFSNSSLSFNTLVHTASFPSYVTQSETNWWTYWSDREMTFEYYASSNLWTESRKVLMSTTFSYSSVTASLDISFISSDPSIIQYLAPNIDVLNSSRYNGMSGVTNSVYPTGQPSIVDPGLTVKDGIYLYDYLMILKCNSNYPINIGDVIKFNSSYVEGNFTVNKIFNGVSSKKYIYMYTDFNENIITNLSKTSSVSPQSMTASIINLNVYNKVIDLENRFNYHPISNGYELIYSTYSNVVTLNPKFNYYSSYYNLATNVNINSDKFTMSYTSGFLNFGYTPTYNLLSYLESLNDDGDINPKFTASKEYYAMPEYRAIPMPGIGNFTASQVYIDYNGLTFSSVYPQQVYSTSNKLLFGRTRELEWKSIFLNTFVDINLYDSNVKWPDISPSSTTEKLLVMKKYFDVDQDVFVIEFNKKINHKVGDPQYYIDIVSRRSLLQISNDLQELNNIHRPKRKKVELKVSSLNPTDVSANGHDYYVYEREMNNKLSSDSYLRILLSDSDTVEQLTGIIYTDYKNELALNITRLEEEFNIPISGTGDYAGNLFIFCSKKHGLKDYDGVVLEFNGGTGSSQEINQNYFGYQTIKVVNEYNFYLEFPYGNIPSTGLDSGFVKYVKVDPFLNFEPVDLIDIGVDKKGKQSIELSVDNLVLSGSKYSLRDIDFTKYRYRLIDNLSLETISLAFPWLLEAEISGATIGITSLSELVWYKGIWESGRWFGGRWISGTWVSGDWYGGTWESKTIKDNILSAEIDEESNNNISSTWFGGRWFDGTWNSGTWTNGRWYGGTWNDVKWYKGIWNNGTWNNGEFTGGIWVLGTWNGGIFNTDTEPAYWLDGLWNAGDFENGMWYNGTWTEKVGVSRFGVNSYNSRTSTWHGGTWLAGSFHSRLNIDDEGYEDVSEVHKYSIWKTGNWFDGDFYGGVAYNIDWRSGTWHGGILEDIEIIGFGNDSPGAYYLTLNGIFKFNTGDQFTVIDNQLGLSYSLTFGSNAHRKTYTVLDTSELVEKSFTKVYVATSFTAQAGYPTAVPFDTTLKVISRFRNCNWKTGIWTNGIYEKGLWEGGIWYNGIFEATWM
jgi:uncharacterized protein (TIGR02145 family)